MKTLFDVIVIGAGPAGMAAALAAGEQGADTLLLERGGQLGGILNQCVHSGFGLRHFNRELTGPEYAERFAREILKGGVSLLTGATALSLSPERTVEAVHPLCGYMRLSAKSVVLAMGCRERTRGAVGIAGTRPAGVFTAGAAQQFINVEGLQIGRRAVILGSGDIGLIMARRLTLEGVDVLGVFEIMPRPGGLARNVVQCLEDFGIRLFLSHTITEIRGDRRVEQIVTARVDGNFAPIAGSEREIDCDTVILSVGLIPENELTKMADAALDPRTGGPVVRENMETSLPGIFACGNVVWVHDLVDNVTAQGALAGRSAAAFARGERGDFPILPPPPKAESYQALEPGEVVCIICPKGCRVKTAHGRTQGNACPRGAEFARRQTENPTRTLTGTVRVSGAAIARLPVKTDVDIPKGLVAKAARMLDEITAAAPVKMGDVLAEIPGTGAKLVAARSLDTVEEENNGKNHL